MATKKPSAAQLAARKKFAAMAKSGALAKARKAAPKKPISRPSQATGKKPSPRLKARREKSIPGYFANPISSEVRKTKRAPSPFQYVVENAPSDLDSLYKPVAGFVNFGDAKAYAYSLHKDMPGLFIRVVEVE
ncbi:MAG: hypothetical protein IPO08_23545 [Xanthomonadales bacterium]|nr:hypothetical protein [Xanthomonadales bacterium]